MSSNRIDWKATLKRLIDGEMLWVDAHALFYTACPRCGKAFEKKQANAVFCGAKCAGAERAARWRKSK